MTAQAALDAILADARRGQLIGQVPRTKATLQRQQLSTFAGSSTIASASGARLTTIGQPVNAHLLPAFGSLRLEEVTAPRIDAWRAQLVAEGRLANKSISKILAVRSES